MSGDASRMLAEVDGHEQCIYLLFNDLIQVDLSYAGAVMTTNEFALFTELLTQSPRPVNAWHAGRIAQGGPRRFVVYCQCHHVFTIGFGNALLRVPLDCYEPLIAACQQACAAIDEASQAKIGPPPLDAFGFSPN